MKSFLISISAIFISIFLVGNLNAEETILCNKIHSGLEILPEASNPNMPHQVYYSITGHVYKEGTSDRFEGVTISFSGGIDSVITDAMGLYSVDVPRGWSGVATPSYCGYYDFTPSEIFYTNVKTDYFDQDYTGAPSQMFTISGRFTTFDTGEPIANTEIDFNNGIILTTNEFGEYSIEKLPCTNDTLTPYLEGYNFNPESRTYQSINYNHTDQDFVGTPNTFGLPPGWEYVNTSEVHIISVFTSANPNFCGEPLQEGDYLGVFYTDDFGELKCGGAGMWTGISNTPVIAQGDDQTTPEKDGFDYGETFTWKVYRWTNDHKEYIAIPDYQCGGFLTCANKWYLTGLSIVEGLDIFDEQFIEIPEGWSGFSSYLNPKTLLVTHTMEPILDELVIMQTLTKMYYPGQNINTIGLWKTNSGYKIRVTSDVVLPIMGCPLTDTQISLSTTWNLIPIISNCNVQLTELVAPVMDNIIVVKEIAGNNLFWPEMGISTLQTLLPGKTYMMAVSQNSLISFPDCGTTLKDGDLNAAGITNNTTWNSPALTPSTHNIAIQAKALNGVEAGDYMGAFTENGYCAGLTQFADVTQNQSITIFGDDVTTTETDGFAEGEKFSFKLYRPSTGKEYKLWVSFDQNLWNGDGQFADNGLSVIGELLFDPAIIDDQNSYSFQIFPNPSSGKIEVISGDETGPYVVNIFSLTGGRVFSTTAIGNTAINLNDLNKGIYIIRIDNETFVKYEKLILE
jgi:hypothetical protein